MPADPQGYELAYVEAKRAFEDQERTVVELRSRAGTLIAAAAITTSFFGGQALSGHELDAAALHMGHSAQLNRDQLRRLTTAFRIGAVLLLAEVIAWGVALVERA